MAFKRSLLIVLLLLTACQSFPPSATPLPTSTKIVDTETPSRTSIPRTSTTTQTSTPVKTPPPPTFTLTFTPTSLTQTIEPTLAPTSTSRPTQPTEGPGPGLVVRGYVKLADGTPVEGVNMYVAFASYGGNVVAVTNSNGYYSSEYIYIPGDETVRVWAEAATYSFKPGSGSAVWTGIEFYWRHYFGFEDRRLDFTAISEPVLQ
jgi:hypothetical protein